LAFTHDRPNPGGLPAMSHSESARTSRNAATTHQDHNSHRRRGPRSARAIIASLAALVVAVTATIVSIPTTPATALDPSVPQEAFLCTTEWNGLGQPIVDNQDGIGTPVYPASDGSIDRSQDPVGWSQNCQADELVEYRYRNTAGDIVTLPDGITQLPSDIAMLPVDDLVGADEMDLGDVDDIPYLFRYQRGTLTETRFLYSMAMLVPFDEVTAE